MELLLSIFGATAQGLTWTIFALGVFITFRILNYADLTCEGSFALGGSISSVFVVGLNLNPYLSLFVALLSGLAAGAVTGLLHTKLKIPSILSGILTMFGLYSINLRIMGQPNTSLVGSKSLIFMIKDKLPTAAELGIKDIILQTGVILVVGLIFSLIAIAFLYWFFGTEIGSCIRATGNNDTMVRAQGVNTDMTKIAGLSFSNGLIALAGALVTQTQGYADVGMGQGVIVIGLASIVIGEVLFLKAKNFAVKMLAILCGSVIYRIIIALILRLGLDTNDMKLFTAIVVALALSIPTLLKNKPLFTRKEVKPPF
ncbi:MAG: ABC transporter permease [Anaerolineaceae bacterium]|nr:MAG: ABC transporter permease [Anaerolineaceae bacterium]